MKRHGESIANILYFWLPEMIIAFIVVALPPLVDSFLVASLHSTNAYGALGMATNLVHMLIKFSEAVPVAAIAIIGRFNGAEKYEQCGSEFIQTLWSALILGTIQLALLWFGAYAIYYWLEVPPEMAALGAPFLKIRAVGVLLAFVAWTCIGFMRALKNTRTPMLITLVGVTTFIITDALLIHGLYGFPKLHIYGSAVASLAEYLAMVGYAFWHLASTPSYKKYFTGLERITPDLKKIIKLLWLSFPIIVDKVSISFAYVWLSKIVAGIGSTNAIISFSIIKDLERSAIMPAVAFAQVITFLVSNSIGANDSRGAKQSVKKVLALTSLMVCATLGVLFFFAPDLVANLSPNKEVVTFAVPVLRWMSIFVIFDFVQIILAGALRGAGNVFVVMWGRVISALFFFVPLSSYIARLPIENIQIKFALIYGSFYLATALMGLFFLVRITQKNWYSKQL